MYKPVDKGGGVGVARVQRQAQILTCLYDQRFPETGALQANAGARAGWLSTGQLARCCDMSPSPHFRLMIAELHEKGFVHGEAETYRRNMQVYFWCIAENTISSSEWSGVFDAYLGVGGVFGRKGGE